MLKKYATTSIFLAGSMSLVGSTAFADDSAADAKAAGQPAPVDISEELVVIGKFVGNTTQSALKQDVRVLDTPASVDDYSNSFMKAIETTNVSNLYSYMTGVQRGGATGYDISIRGFKTSQTDKNAILVDGLPGITGRYGSPPTFATEHIELVKGPASVLYGTDQPGGFVNLITKKPSATAAALVDVTGSTYGGTGDNFGHDNGITADVDFTGSMNKSASLLYRLILEDVHKNSYRGDTFEHSSYIAPSLSWVPSKDTTVTLAAEIRHREAGYDQFLIAPNKDAHLLAGPTVVYQNPGDVLPEKGTSESLTVTHTFAPGVTWNTALRNVKDQDDAVGYDNVSAIFIPATPATKKAPAFPDEWVVVRRARGQHNERTYDFIDSNLSLPLTTGFVEHKILVGANGGVDTTDFARLQFYNGPITGALARPGVGSINVDLYAPNFGVVPALNTFPLGALNDRYARSASYAGYLSDLMQFSEHWKATVGLRYTHDQVYTREQLAIPRTVSGNTHSKVLPTAGLLFEPTTDWTLYTSYSTSFSPVTNTSVDQNGQYTFSPETAYQVEVGTKVNALDSRLTTTFALFDIHRKDVAEPIACIAPAGPTCMQQVGGERSKGAELEVNARPVTGWQVLFGYSLTDAKVNKSSSFGSAPLVGDRLTNSSLNNAHVWSRYDVPSGPLKNLGVGLGAYYVSPHTGNLPNGTDPRLLLLPGYTVVDLAAYYSLFDRFNFTLKVANLLDRRYYEGVNSFTNEIGVVPGSPRYIQLSMRVSLY
jgi:iron complex outermembrane receptor protein